MDMTVPRANRMDQAAANLFMSSQNRNMELTRSPEHYNNGGSAGLLGNRMDELNRQEVFNIVNTGEIDLLKGYRILSSCSDRNW